MLGLSKKKRRDKVKNFLQQVKQKPYHIWTICHRSVRLFKREKYHILTADFYHPVKSFNEKLYIREIFHKHLYNNQTVCNKMTIDPIPGELEHLENLINS